MKMSVCCDNQFGIGKDNKLIYHIDADMEFFKDLTMESGIVLMGHNTFRSLKKKYGLPGRENWVLSKSQFDDRDTLYHGVKFFSSKSSVMKYIRKRAQLDKNSEFADRITVIGGASIYELFIDYIDYISLTMVHIDGNSEADTYLGPKTVKAITNYKDKFIKSASDEFYTGNLKATFNILETNPFL